MIAIVPWMEGCIFAVCHPCYASLRNPILPSPGPRRRWLRVHLLRPLKSLGLEHLWNLTNPECIFGRNVLLGIVQLLRSAEIQRNAFLQRMRSRRRKMENLDLRKAVAEAN